MRGSLATLLALGLLLAGVAPAGAQTIWAVGDAAWPGSPADEAIADRMQAEGIDGLLYLGDVYDSGTAAEYARNYNSALGRFKNFTAPTPGNHEWANRSQGYDRYWGPGVRQPGGGGHWYSFNVGGWHFISLNTMEPFRANSAQMAWLRNDLARYRGTCTVAFTHHPRYSAGPQWNSLGLEAMYAELSRRSVAFLSGHVHNYQRHFPNRGLTQFIVGTGGAPFGNADDFDPRVAAATETRFGALRMRLGLGELTYDFVPTSGPPIDKGRLECDTHVPAPARIKVTRPRNRATYRGLRTFTGRLRNTRRVRLSLVQRVGRRCQAYDFEDDKLRRASCRTRRSYPVELKKPTRFGLKTEEKLPDARYRLTVIARAVDRTLTRKVTRFRVEPAKKRRRR